MSLIPQQVFSQSEDEFFEELVDDAEIEAIVDALFPESLTKPSSK
jgi:hypothetical protein